MSSPKSSPNFPGLLILHTSQRYSVVFPHLLNLNWTNDMLWQSVKVALSCPTLWDPTDYTVHGILQAKILEWVAFPFSRGSSQPRDRTQVSCIAGGFFTSWATIDGQKKKKKRQSASFKPRSQKFLHASISLSWKYSLPQWNKPKPACWISKTCGPVTLLPSWNAANHQT